MRTMKIGNRIIEVDRIENGRPVIKATSEVIPCEGGRQDVVVHVPVLSIGAARKELGGQPQQPEPDPMKGLLTKEFLLILIMCAERYGWSDTEEFVRAIFAMAGRDISEVPREAELKERVEYDSSGGYGGRSLPAF